jgi:hypothetical protein
MGVSFHLSSFKNARRLKGLSVCRDFPGEPMTKSKYIGFYWTLPVPWAGFNALPKDVDEAAEKSITIRYQRDYVRRWVKDGRGELIVEEVFLELAPDRGTDMIIPGVDRLLSRCRKESAKLVLVDFSDAFGWRRHGPLWDRLDQEEFCMPLDPSPIMIDGAEFDPVLHFRTWREIEHSHAATKSDRKADLADAIDQLSETHTTNHSLAKTLNESGLSTPTGKTWTADNLRKFLSTL